MLSSCLLVCLAPLPTSNLGTLVVCDQLERGPGIAYAPNIRGSEMRSILAPHRICSLGRFPSSPWLHSIRKYSGLPGTSPESSETTSPAKYDIMRKFYKASVQDGFQGTFEDSAGERTFMPMKEPSSMVDFRVHTMLGGMRSSAALLEHVHTSPPSVWTKSFKVENLLTFYFVKGLGWLYGRY